MASTRAMLTTPRKRVRCKHIEVHYEGIGGIRVYREVRGAKVYRCRCVSCGMEIERNG